MQTQPKINQIHVPIPCAPIPLISPLNRSMPWRQFFLAACRICMPLYHPRLDASSPPAMPCNRHVTMCTLPAPYWMALTWSPQAQWLWESDKAGELQVG